MMTFSNFSRRLFTLFPFVAAVSLAQIPEPRNIDWPIPIETERDVSGRNGFLLMYLANTDTTRPGFRQVDRAVGYWAPSKPHHRASLTTREIKKIKLKDQTRSLEARYREFLATDPPRISLFGIRQRMSPEEVMSLLKKKGYYWGNAYPQNLVSGQKRFSVIREKSAWAEIMDKVDPDAKSPAGWTNEYIRLIHAGNKLDDQLGLEVYVTFAEAHAPGQPPRAEIRSVSISSVRGRVKTRDAVEAVLDELQKQPHVFEVPRQKTWCGPFGTQIKVNGDQVNVSYADLTGGYLCDDRDAEYRILVSRLISGSHNKPKPKLGL